MRPSGRGRRPPGSAHSRARPALAHGIRHPGTIRGVSRSIRRSSRCRSRAAPILLLILLVAHRGNPVFAAVAAIVGSILGGYLTWATGAKGGEAALHRYLPRRFGKRLSGWVEKRGVGCRHPFGVASSAFSADAVVAGCRALGVSRKRFLGLFQPGENFSLCADSVAGRHVRPGRGRVSPLPGRLEHHHHVDLSGLVVAGILYGLWKFRHQRSQACPRRRSQH